MMDVSKLCRGCMKEVASWEKDNFYTRAVEMFNFCTNIRISDEDNLPKQFCYDCIIKIESSYTFITEAQKVNVTLKNIISRKTSVIVEPDTNKSLALDMKLTLPDYKICSVIESSKQYERKEEPPSSEMKEEKLPETIKEVVNADQNIKNENAIMCTECNKSFISRTWYQKHVDKAHAAMKHSCTHCDKSFSRPSLLSTHLVTHSEERKFSCSSCGKSFKRRKHLAVHARSHGDARPYGCEKCSARFKTKGILKSHMTVHEKDKQFLCYFCGWSFAQAGNLKVHMRQHTGEKPYSCNECGFRAAVASNLRRHERRHAALRSHLCNHCGKGFYDASNLARHVRVHTGALPYRCGAGGCAARFLDSWKRNTHLMRAHHHTLDTLPRLERHTRLDRSLHD